MAFRLSLLVATTALLFGWPQVPENQGGRATTGTHKARESQGPMPPTHIIIDPPIPASSGQPPAPTKQDEPIEKPLPRYRRPEWVIVYITAVYCFITWLTLRKIKRQADLMKEQLTDARAAGVVTASNATATITAIQEQAARLTEQVGLMKQQLNDARTVSLDASKSTAETLSLFKRQADGMDRQAAIMDRQAKLTEIEYRPRIEFCNWRIDITGNAHWVFVSMDISNPTEHPVTIQCGTIKASRGDWHVEFILGPPTEITPDYPYTVSICFQMTEVEQGIFATDGMSFSIRGSFTYTGVLGDKSRAVRPIEGTLMCSPREVRFIPLAHRMNAKPAENGAESQNPN